MNHRIKRLRKNMGLSQKEFGDKLGVSRDVIANVENNRVEPTKLMLNMICREFNVNSLWLEEGKGEMFSGYTDDLIQSVAEEYNLTDFDVALVRAYLGLDKDSRRVIMDFIQKIRPD